MDGSNSWDWLDKWLSGIDFDSEEGALFLVVISFIVVALTSASGVWYLGNALQNYTESAARNKLTEFEKKYPMEEDDNNNSNNRRSDDVVDPFAKFRRMKNKLKLLCVYSSSETPAATIGGSMSIDGETGYVMIAGGVNPAPAAVSVNAKDPLATGGDAPGLRHRKGGSSGTKSKSKPSSSSSTNAPACITAKIAPHADASHMHIYSSSERKWIVYTADHSSSSSSSSATETDGVSPAHIHRAYGCMHNYSDTQSLYFGGIDESGMPRGELCTFDMSAGEIEGVNPTGRWLELPVSDAGRGCHVDPISGEGVNAISIDAEEAAAAGKEYVFTPPARYNASMCRYRDNFYVIFGGCGTNIKTGGADAPTTLRLFNDVWLLHVDHPEFLYYESLYANKAPPHPTEWLQQLDGHNGGSSCSTASSYAPDDFAGSVDTYNRCLDRHLSTAGCAPLVAPPLMLAAPGDGTVKLPAMAAASTACERSPSLEELEITPLPRQAHCAAIVGDNMFVFGGCTSMQTPTASSSSSSPTDSSSIKLSAEGITTHSAGLVELFNLSVFKWFACNACGEHPTGNLVGVSAHTLVDRSREAPMEEQESDAENEEIRDNLENVGEDDPLLSQEWSNSKKKKSGQSANKGYNCSGRIIVLASSSNASSLAKAVNEGGAAEPTGDDANGITLGNIFNTAYVLDVSVVPTAAAGGAKESDFSPLKLLLTWTKFTYHWLGDWSVLPPSRVFYSSAVDEEEGLLYIFGGYSNTSSRGEDLTLLPGLNRGSIEDGAGVRGDDEAWISRDEVRQNRLKHLQATKTATGGSLGFGDSTVQIGVNVYSTRRSGAGAKARSAVGEDGYDCDVHQLAEVTTPPDMLVVDISTLLGDGKHRGATGAIDGPVGARLAGRGTGRGYHSYGEIVDKEEEAKAEMRREVTYFDSDDGPIAPGAASAGRGRQVRMVRDRNGQLTEEYYLPDLDGDVGGGGKDDGEDKGADDEAERGEEVDGADSAPSTSSAASTARNNSRPVHRTTAVHGIKVPRSLKK